ncbi:MAG: NAD(P)-dependent oxidoreductase [Pseudomonadota bacterium]
MKQFPAFFDLVDAPCLLVGGGEEAAAKLRLLHAAGARIELLATALCDEISDALDAGTVHRCNETAPWRSGRYRLVIVADTDADIAATISRDCAARGIPVNVVDQPALCTFTVPAIVDRSPVTVAIGTAGASPVLSRSIKGQIEALLPTALGALASLYASRRAKVKHTVAPADRRTLWELAHNGSVADLAYAGDLPAAARALDSLIDHGPCKATPAAHVTLLDLRHRDADRVTLGELRQLQCAHAVVFDSAVTHALRELCRRDAARHTLLTSSAGVGVIAKQLANLSRTGQRLVVLATGDWFSDENERKLVTRLRSQGLDVESTRSTSTATARCVTAR